MSTATDLEILEVRSLVLNGWFVSCQGGGGLDPIAWRRAPGGAIVTLRNGHNYKLTVKEAK